MQRYRDMKLRKRSNLKMIRNLVFFILLIAFTFWYIFKDQDLNELLNILRNADLKYVFFAIMCMFGAHFTESYNIKCLLTSLGEKKVSILNTFKYTAIGTFFSAITPAATGGQPVEVYYMSKDKIKVANGTLALLVEVCGYQASIVLYAIICGIIYNNLLSGGVFWFYLIGLIFNSFVLVVMICGIFTNKVSEKFLNFFIKILSLAKVKNLELKKKKMYEGLKQYRESAKYIKQHKSEFVKSMFRVLFQIFLFHSIPFFIYRAFGLNNLSFLQLFGMQAILFNTVASIPLPGSIGVSETLFLKIYKQAFSEKMISGAMLLSRFSSFYFFMILFSIIVIVNAVKTKNIKSQIDKDVKLIEKERKDYRKLSFS